MSMMACSVAKQRHGLMLVMSAVVIIAGILVVISLSVVLVQVNSSHCRFCDEHETRAELSRLQMIVGDLNRTVGSLMNQLETASLEQDSKIDTVRESLAMNITMLSSSLANQVQIGTTVLSGFNVFENCTMSVEGHCTISPPTMQGNHPAPCITSEVLVNKVSTFNLDFGCIRAAESRDANNPLVVILNFAENFFGENIAECHCYIVVDDAWNPLTHNVSCGIQVTRCTILQNITAQFFVP